MKSFFFWLLRVGEALLVAHAFYSAHQWRQSLEKTHATADVLMYFFQVVVLGAIAFSCYIQIKNRYSAR